MECVDHTNMVCNTEDPYFKDCFYWGELKTIPMAELVKTDPEITNEQMESTKYSQSWYNYYINHSSTKTLYFTEILVLCFILITRRLTFVYKKKETDGTFKVVEKTTTLIRLWRCSKRESLKE